MLKQINIQDVVSIAKNAGDKIMQVYHQDFKVEYKSDSSPLTKADKAANKIIERGLKQVLNVPLLSEEGKKINYNLRSQWQYFWLVDPLDGTKEFVNKNDEFTVNIALMHVDTPVLGVVYAPALEVCFWAKQTEGAFKDGRQLPIKNNDNSYNIVASRSHINPETQQFIEQIQTTKPKKIISIGSSLKICLVAEGEADIYPRLGPTMEWDTAAAHAIVRGAEASLVDFNSGDELKYNKENLLNPYFVVKRSVT